MIRLKTRPQFQAVLAGRMLSKTTHFALHCNWLDAVASPQSASAAPGVSAPLFPENGVWFGAMVPKRWAKRAVTRNAIKRQIYAVGLQYEWVFAHGAHLVRLRSAFDRSQFISATSDALKTAVRLELLQLFERVQRQPAAKPEL